MSLQNENSSNESRNSTKWGLFGVATLIGLAAAALVVVNRTKKDGTRWSVDDLISAADRAAEKLEHTLLGETVRAS